MPPADPPPAAPRRFTRAQALQNRAFLRELARSGNARDAARTLGLHRATMTKRRAAHPAFAAEWDAALALANAALKYPPRNGEGDRAPAARGGGGSPKSQRPEEPHVVRTRSGRLQLRRAVPGRITRAAEQAFLRALSATANVRLSAAAAGHSHAGFYGRAQASPAFAREMRLALETGYDRVEMAMLAAALPASHRDDAWRHGELPPIPPLTADEALQLLRLHQKQVRLQAEPAHLKRRRGESHEARATRLKGMYEAEQDWRREQFRVRQAAEAAEAAEAAGAETGRWEEEWCCRIWRGCGGGGDDRG